MVVLGHFLESFCCNKGLKRCEYMHGVCVCVCVLTCVHWVNPQALRIFACEWVVENNWNVTEFKIHFGHPSWDLYSSTTIYVRCDCHIKLLFISYKLWPVLVVTLMYVTYVANPSSQKLLLFMDLNVFKIVILVMWLFYHVIFHVIFKSVNTWT